MQRINDSEHGPMMNATLTPEDLAARWRAPFSKVMAMDCDTGPKFFLVGKERRYRLRDVLDYEAGQETMHKFAQMKPDDQKKVLDDLKAKGYR